MTVLGNRLLCKPHKHEETEGGVLVPDSAEHTSAFEVKLVGEDVEKVGVGDVIHVSARVSDPKRANVIHYKGEDYVIFTPDNIIIMEENENEIIT